MSKTVEIQSPEQFSELLRKSRIVVADCESTAIPPYLSVLSLRYPATILRCKFGAVFWVLQVDVLRGPPCTP